METDDLRNLWRVGDASAEDHFKELKADLDAIAQGKSKSVVSKFMRWLRFEMILSIILSIVLGASTFFFAPLPSLIVTMLLLAYVLYFAAEAMVTLGKRLDSVADGDIKHQLDEYIANIDGFIKHISRYMYYIMPFTPIPGALEGALEEEALQDALISFGLSYVLAAPFIALLLWYCIKKYIPQFYGPYLNELIEIRRNLEEGEEEL